MTNSNASKKSEPVDELHEPVQPKRRKVFVISPIGSEGSDIREHADDVLDFVIKAGLPIDFWDVTRADAHDNPDSITRTMMEAINESDLIVALLTGHNPNVFYELAVAHCWEKPVVCLLKAGEPVPFDVKDTRIIPYDLTSPRSVQSVVKTMGTYAHAAISSGTDHVSPVTAQIAKRQAEPSKPQPAKPSAKQGAGAINERIIGMLEEMNSRIAGLENRMVIRSGQMPRTFNSTSEGRNVVSAKSNTREYLRTASGKMLSPNEMTERDRMPIADSSTPRGQKYIELHMNKQREDELRDLLNRKASSGKVLSDLEIAAMNGNDAALQYLLEN